MADRPSPVRLANVAVLTRDREHLLKTMQNLLQDPYQKGSFVERGPNGRDYEIKVSGPFHVAFWLDAWDKEIRIVRIEKLTNR